MEEDSEPEDIPNERQCSDSAHTRLLSAVQVLLGQRQVLQQVKDFVLSQEHILENILVELPAVPAVTPGVSNRDSSRSEVAPRKDSRACEESFVNNFKRVGYSTSGKITKKYRAREDSCDVTHMASELSIFPRRSNARKDLESNSWCDAPSQNWRNFCTSSNPDRSSTTRFHELAESAAKLFMLQPNEDGALSRCVRPFVHWWRLVLQNVLKRPRNSSYLARCVKSRVFESLCGVIISLNAVCIGWQTDYARKNVSEQSTDFMGIMEWFFGIYYTAELTLRIYVDRCLFFFGPDVAWNAFDIFLVCSAIQDQITAVLTKDSQGSSGSMSYLRIMRLMKMLKLLRMVRLLRMFRELRLILNSIMGSVKSMFWSMVLIFALLFMFGIAFLQAITDYLEQQGESASPEIKADMDTMWGSLPQAFLALYMTCMSGEEWRKIASPLWECGWFIYALFLFFVGFYVFVIANTLTSLFVESTIQNAEKDDRGVVQAEMEQKDKYIKVLRRWYRRIDENDTGTITLQDAQSFLDAPEMLAFATLPGIEPLDIKQFFQVVTVNGTKAVDLETFVVGAIKLKGMAKSMDMMDLLFSHRQFVQDQNSFNAFAEHRFGCIDESLAQILQRVRRTMKRGVDQNRVTQPIGM